MQYTGAQIARIWLCHRWAGKDSNLRLTDYESAALTN